MLCIDFLLFFKFCVKQLTIFGRTVVAASDFKNCTMVHCDWDICRFTYTEGIKKTQQSLELIGNIKYNANRLCR